MATHRKSSKAKAPRKRFVGKPGGQIQARVRAAGPERFGIVAVDCAKRRSKWMLCDFYGKVVVEPNEVEHTKGGLQTMIERIAQAAKSEGLVDFIVAVEMTGIYHQPVRRARGMS